MKANKLSKFKHILVSSAPPGIFLYGGRDGVSPYSHSEGSRLGGVPEFFDCTVKLVSPQGLSARLLRECAAISVSAFLAALGITGASSVLLSLAPKLFGRIIVLNLLEETLQAKRQADERGVCSIRRSGFQSMGVKPKMVVSICLKLRIFQKLRNI